MTKQWIISLLMLSASSAWAQEIRPSIELSRKQGLLILDLDIKATVSEISFNKGKLKLGPYQPGRYIELIPVEKGSYQLSTVAAPHYDLPFRLNFHKYPNLRFNVEAQHLNYFGQIILAQSRSSDSLNIRVENRLASSTAAIKEKSADLLNFYPLHYAGLHQDHFFQRFLKIVEVKNEP